jgi:hypothetical protein
MYRWLRYSNVIHINIDVNNNASNPNIDICKMKFSKSALISSNMKLNCGMKVLVKDSKTTNGRDIRVNSKKLSV